jgi:hypothetical protein
MLTSLESTKNVGQFGHDPLHGDLEETGSEQLGSDPSVASIRS